MAGPMQHGLPIRPFKDTILETVAQNDFTIIIGETGSGKTTQVAQVCPVTQNWFTCHKSVALPGSGLQILPMCADAGRGWLCKEGTHSCHTA